MLLIVAVTGMPGAGKSTAAKALESRGWSRIVMGDVIREETRRRGLKEDEGGTGSVMRQLRSELGESAIAELCVKKIIESGWNRVVVDGIRSMAEVETFERVGRVKLVAVHASRQRRFAFLKERGRSDDPITYEMFLKRDKRELEIGIGNAIALADEVISNEHATPEQLSREMLSVVEEWAESEGR